MTTVPLCLHTWTSICLLFHVSHPHPETPTSQCSAPLQMPQFPWSCFLSSSTLALCITPTSPSLFIAWHTLQAQSKCQLSWKLSATFPGRIDILLLWVSTILCTLFVHYATTILGSSLMSISSIRL